MLNGSLKDDTMQESDYGSSQYRQFPTFSTNLKVSAGTNKPSKVKQKPQITKPVGLGPINRNPQKPGNK